MEEGKIIVNLSQADTLKFKGNEVVKVQLRARLSDGEAIGCKIRSLKVADILKEGEI